MYFLVWYILVHACMHACEEVRMWYILMHACMHVRSFDMSRRAYMHVSSFDMSRAVWAIDVGHMLGYG